MKKLALLLFALTLMTSCDVEPLDPAYNQGGNQGGGSGSESADLTMSLYELDTQISLVFFGLPIETITNSDLNISSNKIASGTNALSTNGSAFENENLIITRNSSGQIINDKSVNNAGVTTNETSVTYTNGVISQITYDYYEDDEDDYTYNFTYEGNQITRTKVGSTEMTVFRVDALDRIVSKESYVNGFAAQIETIAYDSNGNISSSVTSIETESNTTYAFDDNINPLKVIYEDNYLLPFLRDEYSDEIGPQIAQFLSTNNWKGASFNGTAFNFNLEYNSVGRIKSRDIAYNFGPELSFEINERFNFVN
ncbi:hypothetical protein [Winogradskyella thalassocola]|uniref:YD repeat-containing protein n=1 Tax=Winogradskyella thalassocola TaxID=262004 RepID=A0A1G7ZJL4_9FLAO|nr:hypothetical protein [Winogradskyella thalassocola]SDH08903.1 hypothetical protein SAMN04489796_1011353 [Winogradskyella thalassocola]